MSALAQHPPLSVRTHSKFRKIQFFAPKIAYVHIWRIPSPLSANCPHWTNHKLPALTADVFYGQPLINCFERFPLALVKNLTRMNLFSHLIQMSWNLKTKLLALRQSDADWLKRIWRLIGWRTEHVIGWCDKKKTVDADQSKCKSSQYLTLTFNWIEKNNYAKNNNSYS